MADSLDSIQRINGALEGRARLEREIGVEGRERTSGGTLFRASIAAILPQLLVSGCTGDTSAGPSAPGRDPTGALLVAVATTGPHPDTDGFRLVLDGTTSQSISLNDSHTFVDLRVGSHTVELTDGADELAGYDPVTFRVIDRIYGSVNVDLR